MRAFTDLLFKRLSLCVSRDSLSSHTPSLDRCILFKYIYKYFAPFLRFSHTLLYTNFHIFNSKRNIFLIPVTPLIGEILDFNSRLQQLKASLEQYFTF